MNTVSRQDMEGPKLTTADLAAATQQSAQPDGDAGIRQPERAEAKRDGADRPDQELAPLFDGGAAADFRARWDAVQISFVDDPARAVREADELVAQVMKSLADSFSRERTGFEGEVRQAGNASTETMRVALKRYRSFFQRLLSL
jgi:hypothetical protein